MAWKNWGDHPIVVSIGVLAGLAGLVALGVTLLAEPQTSQRPDSVQKEKPQTSQGNNSPNINNANGNVNLNIDNSTKVETPSRKVPEFSGRIGSGSKSDAFREFIYKNDNKVVFLNVYIDVLDTTKESDKLNVDKDIVEKAKDRREQVPVCYKSSSDQCKENRFLLYHRCSDPDPGGASVPCAGMAYNLSMPNNSNGLFSYAQGTYYLKGFWSVRANPGMWQGIMSTTLSSVDVQDAK